MASDLPPAADPMAAPKLLASKKPPHLRDIEIKGKKDEDESQSSSTYSRLSPPLTPASPLKEGETKIPIARHSPVPLSEHWQVPELVAHEIPGQHAPGIDSKEGDQPRMVPTRDPMGQVKPEGFDRALMKLMDRTVFLRILRDPIGLHKFGQYLRDQGVHEQLIFHLNCEQLDHELTRLRDLTNRIYNLHLHTAAPMSIGLPPEQLRNAEINVDNFRKLQQPFLQPQTVAFENMYQQHFGTFLQYRLALLQRRKLREMAMLDERSEVRDTAYTSHGKLRTGLGDCFLLSDASPGLDLPIVMASDGFIALTGYEREEMCFTNCRFLQGPGTSRAAVTRIREALTECKEVTELILNYRKDGTPFWNLLVIAPLKNDYGETKYFLGGQINVTPSLMNARDLSFLLADENDPEEMKESCSRKNVATGTGRTTAGQFESQKRSIFSRMAKACMPGTRDEGENQRNEQRDSRSMGGIRLQGLSVVGAEAHVLDVDLPIQQQAALVYAAYSRFFLVSSTAHTILFVSPHMGAEDKPAGSLGGDDQQDFGSAIGRALPLGAHLPSVLAKFNSRRLVNTVKDALNNGENLSIGGVKFSHHARNRRTDTRPTGGLPVIGSEEPRGKKRFSRESTLHMTALKDRNDDVGAWVVVMS